MQPSDIYFPHDVTDVTVVNNKDLKITIKTATDESTFTHEFTVNWHSDANYPEAGGKFDESKIWTGRPTTLARTGKTGRLLIRREFLATFPNPDAWLRGLKWPDGGAE
jgi:hypothetical protein